MDRLMSTPFVKLVTGENYSPLNCTETISTYYKEFALEVVNLCRTKNDEMPVYFTLVYTRLEFNELIEKFESGGDKKK